MKRKIAPRKEEQEEQEEQQFSNFKDRDERLAVINLITFLRVMDFHNCFLFSQNIACGQALKLIFSLVDLSDWMARFARLQC